MLRKLNFDNVNDVNARGPMDLGYMKKIRYLLRLMSSWPHRALGENVKPIPFRDSRFLFVLWTFLLVNSVIYLTQNFNKISFFVLGRTYITVLVTTVCVIYKYIHRICGIFVTALYAETFFGAIMFANLLPLYKNYRKGMFSQEPPPNEFFEHSVNYYLPFIKHYSNMNAYIFIAIFNIFYSHDFILCFCGFDFLISVILFHIWGHLKILDNNLQSIPKPLEMRNQKTGQSGDELSYSKEENKKIASILKDIIDHHRLIMRFVTSTSDAFGPMLCLYYVYHQVSGCLLLLECSKLDVPSLAQYGILTVNHFQLLIQISVFVELLGSQSETLKDAVYSIPWEYMDTSNRRIVLFMLCNVQKPIRLKPMGMVSIGVQTMAAIMKTTFSYFMLVQTFS